MYFLYADESGDVGTKNSPTKYFCLSGFVVHELRWHETLEAIINVVVDKQNKAQEIDVFEMAWTTLIQRFHNTLSYKNFPGPQNADDRGMLVVDRTDEVKLRNMTRRMRRYNPIPSAYGGASLAKPITTIVEDAVHRDSLHSYFIQLADVNAYFLLQKYDPCKYVKNKGGTNYFSRLNSALCTVACKSHSQGIVVR
ncbi:MAG: DUF3800 domain-containing protein [Candidatus Thiodiazotropha sp. 4PDIVS1]